MHSNLEEPASGEELRHVIPASRQVGQLLPALSSPFKPPSVSNRLRQAIILKVVKLTEWLLSAQLYVDNRYDDLHSLEPRTRIFLARLLDQGIITAWRRQPHTAGLSQPQIIVLTMSPVTLPSGDKISLGGSTGTGTGYSIQQAFVPAFGELVERHSSTRWQEQSLVFGSYIQLRNKKAVAPEVFTFFSKNQQQQKQFRRSIVNNDTALHWIKATTQENKSCLIPAQLVFTFYPRAFPAEPVFYSVSSNATGAGTTFAQAASSALLEGIERDGLLIFWLNRLQPPKIDVSQTGNVRLIEAKQLCENLGLRFEVVNCTTELGVPTFVSVITGHDKPGLVIMSAVAGFNVGEELEKLARETLKGLHFWRPPSGVPPLASSLKTINDRRHFLADPELMAEVEHFLSGAVQPLCVESVTLSHEKQLEKLRTIFTTHHLACYLVDISTTLAKEAGLVVVKAVAPDLVPIHFIESKPHLGVTRLYQVPRKLGYTDQDTLEADLNPVPHPFL